MAERTLTVHGLLIGVGAAMIILGAGWELKFVGLCAFFLGLAGMIRKE